MRAPLVLLLLLSASCNKLTGGHPPKLPDASTPDGDAGGGACPSQKLAFTQATACQNDGSVEFCVSSIDPAEQDQVFGIAPNVQCRPEAGRAGCDPAEEVLCQLPTIGGVCGAQGLSDASWERVCALAQLTFVERIVPTFFE
jgi:hypothetical protein